MEKTVTVPKKKGKIRQFIPLYLMALPGLLYLLINNYLPMVRFDHRVPQCQLRQGHLEERLVWPGKFQVSVCHQGCLGHHPQYHRL